MLGLGAAKYRGAGLLDTSAEALSITNQHQLVELRHRFGVLPNLLLGGWIQDGEASVDMPFVGVDPESHIDFDILYTSYIARYLPRELLIGVPCLSHAANRLARLFRKNGPSVMVEQVCHTSEMQRG